MQLPQKACVLGVIIVIVQRQVFSGVIIVIVQRQLYSGVLIVILPLGRLNEDLLIWVMT